MQGASRRTCSRRSSRATVGSNGARAAHDGPLLDTDGDRRSSTLREFWAYHVVMEDGRTQNKVDLLLRGGVDGRLGRRELGS